MRPMQGRAPVESWSFHRWLRDATRRDDPVGDFARDVAADVAFPKDARFVSDLEWFVNEWFGGNDAVYKAFIRAWREYRQSEAGRNHFRRCVRRTFVRAARSRASASTAVRPSRSIGPQLRAFVLERDGFRCRRCGNGPEDDRLVIDHIEPVSHGGTDSPENLQTLCEQCNAGKGARDPHPHDRRPFR